MLLETEQAGNGTALYHHEDARASGGAGYARVTAERVFEFHEAKHLTSACRLEVAAEAAPV